MENNYYVPTATPPPFRQQTVDADTGIKEFKRAKAMIMTILVINAVFTMSLLIPNTFNPTVFYGYNVLYVVLWLLGCWQFTRMPQKSFRTGGWYIGGWALFNMATTFLSPLLNQALYNTSFDFLGGPVLQLIGFFILLLGVLAFCSNDGINYAALSLIIAMNLICVGMSFVQSLPFHITGTFAREISFFNAIMNVCFVWAWWMFFKYTVPAPESESAEHELSFGSLAGNRIFIGVAVTMALMVAVLFLIADIILKS